MTPNSQESSKQPVRRRTSGRAPVVLEITKQLVIGQVRGCQLVLRPPSDQAGAEWPGRSLGAKGGKRATKSKTGAEYQGLSD